MLATIVASLAPADYLSAPDVSDKLGHGLTYATLTVWFAGIYERPAAPLIGVALLLLGVTLEGAQALTESRTPEGADLLANLTGIVIALVLARAGLDRWCAMVEHWLGAGR